MQLGGTLMNPRVEVSAGLFVAGGDPQEWFRMDADLLLEEGELTLKANGYDRGTRLLTVDGGASTKVEILTGWLFEDGAEPDMARVQTWMPNFELRIVPLFIPVEKLGYFVKMPPDLEGKVSGAVRISGNPERPEFGGGIQLTEASVGDVTIAPAVVGLSPAEGGYSIFGTFGFSDQEGGLPAMLSLRGTVPFVLDLGDFDLNREMAREGLVLSVEGDGIPVAMARLVDPAITDASGLIHIDGGVAGSLAAPWPNLKIDMVDGAFTYEELEVRFPHVHLDSTLVGNEWRLQSLRMDSEPTQASAFARLGGGIVDSATGGLIEGLNAVFNDVEPLPCAKTFGLEPKEIFVHGTTQIRGFELGRVNLDVCTRTAWVSATEEITLAVGTDLKMRGRWPELQVTGRSKVARGDMDFDESFFVDEGTLRVDPNLTILRTDVDETLARSAQSPDFWWPWDMHVEVDLNRASQLSAVFPLLSGYESLQLQELRLEDADVDGVMQVHMHEDLLEAYGEVTVMRGIVEVMNKDFRVEKGELIFSGDYENPALDLDASRNTGRYGIIGVRIGQTALVPSLEFYSEEDLTNTDILSILLVGVPTSQLQGGAGDIVAVVSLMAEGVLTEQAEGLAGNLFDSLQISTIGDAITDDSGQITGEQTDITATFGKKLGNRGYLEVEFDAVQDPGEEVSHWDLTLEFIVTRRLQAEFTKTAEDDQTGADLLYTWKF